MAKQICLLNPYHIITTSHSKRGSLNCMYAHLYVHEAERISHGKSQAYEVLLMVVKMDSNFVTSHSLKSV